jgi:IS30 family transposase
MAQMGRPGLTHAQKVELWKRWKRGQSLSDIGRALGKHAGSIHGVVSAKGGIAPARRLRSRIALTLGEREEISRGIARGESLRRIAQRLQRSVATVSRELRRHGGRHCYRATVADERAWQNSLRPKTCKLAQHHSLRRLVATKLRCDWSPAQIAGWLKRSFAADENLYVSHETIYRTLFIQARGALKKELVKHLRSRRMMRRAKNSSTQGQPRGRIVDAVSIRDRPASVSDRAVPGHWEGDLLTGASNSHIATLVERHSRFTMLVKLQGKDTHNVVTALSRQMSQLPAQLRQSLTWDRGGELAQHKQFSVATGIPVYFCDPQSPWQRGTNENTNRLLRQYFPDGTQLRSYSQADLNRVAKRLNERPRKTLDYRTPAQALEETLR